MARLDKRLFAPFAIEMDENPKIFPLSDAAFRALFEAVFYSRRMLSDGFLDKRVVLKRWGKAVADELSTNDPERPTWVAVEGGWQIHDFGKHNPLRADIEATTEARRVSGSKGGTVSGLSRSKSEANGKPTVSQTNPETETETETETASLTSEAKLKATRLPESWVPTKAHYDLAKTNRLNLPAEVESFRLHAETHDRHAARWNAAFTTWLKKAKPMAKGGGSDWAFKM